MNKNTPSFLWKDLGPCSVLRKPTYKIAERGIFDEQDGELLEYLTLIISCSRVRKLKSCATFFEGKTYFLH